ncbi:3-oxoacyl-[acyl-carrier-protein] reductase FabG [Methylobacterium crusticola]|uniref:3-oxoacyl-[acyl-carrier-protein] reductase FabG n=1 Tax=Methylobacterium crusticola TaxID=1697972 RepID=A0ABQ4RAA0_9HYPH|nr:SDR family oxidoreductase [Methylobacterium crusticola]GJD53706.1 3-oxoacyl-[acyl-carrier-protein] reductase FabG [Methylobacterium crusticola]
MDFQDKVIWVTGASGALGLASALTLARRGATVVASARSIETTDFGGADIHRLPVDVTETSSVDRAFAALLARHGRIDGLVASTNVGRFGDFLDLDDDAWRAVFEAKLLGSVRPVRAALPTLVKQGAGAIVLISGRGGIDPPPHHFPGSSVNAALDLLVQGLGRRYGPDGIRVNAVAPGPIQSPRLAEMRQGGQAPPANLQTATPGPGLPQDVADAVAYLLSDAARFVNGARLAVDGGGPPLVR